MQLTQIYIEEYLNSGGARKCHRCNKDSHKSLCNKHLVKAKLKFREWTTKRLKRCLCIKCNFKSHKVTNAIGETRQGVYCFNHREENRANCLKWSKSHRFEKIKQYKTAKNLGLCTRSMKHGKSYKNFTKCKTCFFRYKFYMTAYRLQ